MLHSASTPHTVALLSALHNGLAKQRHGGSQGAWVSYEDFAEKTRKHGQRRVFEALRVIFLVLFKRRYGVILESYRSIERHVDHVISIIVELFLFLLLLLLLYMISYHLRRMICAVGLRAHAAGGAELRGGGHRGLGGRVPDAAGMVFGRFFIVFHRFPSFFMPKTHGFGPRGSIFTRFPCRF